MFRYWDVHYDIDWDHTRAWFGDQMRSRLADSVKVHLRSDVPVGAYVSGGIDSSLIAILAGREEASGRIGFHGKFTEFPGYDESPFAETGLPRRAASTLRRSKSPLRIFATTSRSVIYHLDTPVAGPGSFRAVHGFATGRAARQGGARRPGRR